MAPDLRWQTGDGQVVPLDDTAGIKVLRGVTGLGVAPVEAAREERVGDDGAVSFRRRRGVRPFTIPIQIDTAVISFEAAAALFEPVLLPPVVAGGAPRLQGGTLIATNGGGERSLEGVSYDTGMEDEWSDTAGGIGDWSWKQFRGLTLTADDPWWYGPLESITLNIAAETPIDDASTLIDDPNTPIDGGSSTTVPVAGQADAYARFVIDGPFTTLILSGPNGETNELAASLADGDQIVIDWTPSRRGPRLNGGRVSWSLLTASHQRFVLGRPSTVVSVSATGTTANSNVDLLWRNRYLTP
jgi:hypothetical protein